MDPRQALQTNSIDYPTRDGRPMGETDDHRKEMQVFLIEVLEDYFQRDPNVYVSGNNFLYYNEGVLGDCVCPDLYVVKGVPNGQRDTYKVWEEGGRVPCLVIEVTSKNTRMEDLGDKMAKYRDVLGVREYIMFDPRAEWIPTRLRGYLLQDGVYQPMSAGPSGRLSSPELGLELVTVGRHLRFYAPGATEPLPTRVERADNAEEENRRLRAELNRLRGGEQGPERP